jgi:hypothetical protein
MRRSPGRTGTSAALLLFLLFLPPPREDCLGRGFDGVGGGADDAGILLSHQGGEGRLSEVCEGPLDEVAACLQRVSCPARLSAVRTCLQSSTLVQRGAATRPSFPTPVADPGLPCAAGGGREEVCEVEVDRWVGCTLNTAVESLRGLSGARAHQ